VGYSRIASVAVLPDASGIVVNLSNSPLATSAVVKDHLEGALDVPVDIGFTSLVDVAAGTRQADVAPYSGGAFFIVGASACTTGFGVVNNATALQYMLTA